MGKGCSGSLAWHPIRDRASQDEWTVLACLLVAETVVLETQAGVDCFSVSVLLSAFLDSSS